MYKTVSLLGFAVLLLSACAGEVQQIPMLIGKHEGKPLYSFRGFTPSGKSSNADIEPTVKEWVEAFCPKGDREIVDIQPNGWMIGANQIGWNATFTCTRMGKL